MKIYFLLSIDNLKNSNNEKKKKKKNDNIKGNRHHYRHKFVIFLRVISNNLTAGVVSV